MGKVKEATEVKHVPTPWEMYLDGDSDKWHIGSYASVSLGKNVAIAETVDNRPLYQASKEEQKANAAFIVRAVNSHEALLEIAKHALFLERNSRYPEWAEKIQKAIEQAEGK